MHRCANGMHRVRKCLKNKINNELSNIEMNIKDYNVKVYLRVTS